MKTKLFSAFCAALCAILLAGCTQAQPTPGTSEPTESTTVTDAQTTVLTTVPVTGQAEDPKAKPETRFLEEIIRDSNTAEELLSGIQALDTEGAVKEIRIHEWWKHYDRGICLTKGKILKSIALIEILYTDGSKNIYAGTTSKDSPLISGEFAVRVLLCIRDIDVTLGELKQKLDALDTDKKITKISYYSDKTSFENGVETTDESVKIIDGFLQTVRVFYTENGEEKLVEHTVIPKGFDLGKAYSVAFTLTEELSDLTTAEKLKERVSALDTEKEITAVRIERTSPETNAKTEITAGELKENDLVFLADSTSEYCFRISAEGE